MVGIASLISMCITLLVTAVLPIVLYIAYGVKNKQKEIWIAGALGACGFVLLQVMIRLQIVSSVAAIPGYMEWVSNHYIVYSMILAFTAGLFEVVARYGVAKVLDKNKGLAQELTYKTGIAAGIGHGGIEAVVLVGSTYANNLIIAILINTGIWDTMLDLHASSASTGGEGARMLYEQYMLVKEQLVETEWHLFLLAGYERILTMLAHIAMTLVVFYFVNKKKDVVGILICLLWHTSIDFVVPIISGLAMEYLGNRITVNMSYVFIYAFLTIVASISIFVILRIKKNWKPQESSSLINE